MRPLRVWICFLGLLASSGCGKSDPLHRQAVSGKITLGGEPLKTGAIEFTPVDKGTSSGATIKDGEYQIPKEKGLPPGDYVVRINASNGGAAPVEAPGESNKISPELVPAKYNTKTTLQFHVDDEGENVFNLDMDKK